MSSRSRSCGKTPYAAAFPGTRSAWPTAGSLVRWFRMFFDASLFIAQFFIRVACKRKGHFAGHRGTGSAGPLVAPP